MRPKLFITVVLFDLHQPDTLLLSKLCATVDSGSHSVDTAASPVAYLTAFYAIVFFIFQRLWLRELFHCFVLIPFTLQKQLKKTRTWHALWEEKIHHNRSKATCSTVSILSGITEALLLKTTNDKVRFSLTPGFRRNSFTMLSSCKG